MSKIKNVEQSTASIFNFFIFFTFIVLSRTFLEFIYTKDHLKLENFAHIYISFFWVASSLMVLTKIFFFEDELEAIARKIFSAMAIIILPPIIDLLISQGKGLYLSYYTPWEFEKVPGFWQSFFTFFGHYRGYGATPGIQIELALGLLLSFLYSFSYKNKKFLPSVLYSITIYLTVMVLGYFPYLWDLLFKWLNIVFYFNHHNFAILFLLLIILNLNLLFILEKPRDFKILIKKILKSEIYYFFLIAGIGLFWAYESMGKFEWDQDKYFRLILFFLSMLFAQIFFIFVREKKNLERFEWSILILSFITTAYLGFLSFFFYLIYWIGNYLIISKNIQGKVFGVLFCVVSVAIMSYGSTISSPNAYPTLKNVLTIFLLSSIIYFIKDFLDDKKRFYSIFQLNRKS